VPDPQDLRYNPRHGALSRGDLQLLGGLPTAGESIISDLPATP